MLMISLLNAPTAMAKCIQLCMFMPRATNSLLTIARKGGSVRVYSSSDLNLRESGWLIFSLHWLGCANTHRCTSGWNNAAPFFRKSTQGLRTPGCIRQDNNSSTITCRCASSHGDIFFLTLMLLFFSLLSTRLRPPSSPGGSGPTEGPALSLKWTMLLLAEAKNL